jgi:hypothetical protein
MLVYPLRAWETISHDGRTGADGGVDIRAIERLENGAERKWCIQCRRYGKAPAATLRTALDDVLSEGEPAPDALIVAVACNVTKKAREAYERHARAKGVTRPVLWTESILEAMLYSSRHDLLFAFCGVPLAHQEREREAGLRRSIAMKRRLASILQTKKRGHRMVIRSVDDESYPDHNAALPLKDGAYIDTWFHLEFNRTYFGGLEFVLDCVSIVRDDQGHWDLVDPTGVGEQNAPNATEVSSGDGEHLRVERGWQVARIPYRNIVEIDEDGDEFERGPHLFCRYAERGRPYESILYVVGEHDYLGHEKRVRFPDPRS